MDLNRNNYHSQEANKEFMSVSQYKDFLNCEAMAKANIDGTFKEESNDALLIGSAVHAWAEGKLQAFKIMHPEMYKKDGSLYAKYECIEKMTNALEQDEFIKFCMQGDKEHIMTFEMFGVLWKCQIDIINVEAKRIVDIKTTRSIRELSWNDKTKIKESFIEKYNYPLQFAVYAEADKIVNKRDEWFEPIMIVVSKEDVPDKELISMKDPERFTYELTMIEQRLPRIIDVKNGKVKPQRCGLCDYCKSTKKIERIIHYSELSGV